MLWKHFKEIDWMYFMKEVMMLVVCYVLGAAESYQKFIYFSPLFSLIPKPNRYYNNLKAFE